MELGEYLEVLREQIRCAKIGDMVVDEVRGHIEDQAGTYMREGMEEKAALNEAVRQMGDPVEAGVALDRIHRPVMDWKLVLLVGILSAAGLVIQYGLCREAADMSLFWRQCWYTGIGMLVMCGVCLADYSVIGKYVFWLYGALSAGILLVVLFGPVVNGSHHYIKNFVYLYVPIFAGILYHYRGGGYGTLVKCGVLHGAAMIISLRAVTVPVCIDVTVICLVMTSFGIWNGWFAVRRKAALPAMWGTMVLLTLVCMGVGIIGLQPYQMDRIQSILNPQADPTGSGYIPSVIREALICSEWIGQGGKPLLGWLANLHTDYVLVQLISSYGRIAGMLLLVLIGVFLIHICRIVGRQKNQLGQMLSLGCCLVFGIQIVQYVTLNLGIGVMNTGLLFVSYGMSLVLVTFVLTGLLLSIYRYKNISRDRKPSYRGEDPDVRKQSYQEYGI